MTYTVGSYLARRLQQIGLKHHFAVAGDFNLVLLDELLTVKELEQVYCCNELNCGYSAEGYARACGAAAAVVTFSVGGLSAINAIGGSYAENLPVILVSGAPNSNDRATEHLIHHTLATHDWSYQLEIARKLTCAAVSINSAIDAPLQIDHAIRARCVRRSQPISKLHAMLHRLRVLGRARSARSLARSRATPKRCMPPLGLLLNFCRASRNQSS